MQGRLELVRSKLDRLRTADPKRRVFGAKRIGDYGHEYREHRALDSAQLADLEAEHGVTFPDDLRAFLQGVHGGGPGPGYGFELWGEAPRTTRPFPFTMTDLETLIEARRNDPHASLPMDDEDDRDASWPPGSGFMAIATHGCGVYDVIVVTGELRGTIWCCDMAWRPYAARERPLGFLDWYESWLDANLTPQSLARLEAP